MRPRRFTYTLAALNATGYVSNATGATWPLDSTTGPADGMAHQVTIHGDAATNHSAKTAVITGTDAEGKAQTETVNLPNGVATVTSTKYFATVTSVVPSATIGADTMDVGWNAACVSPMFPTDPNQKSGPLVTAGVGGTITLTAQQTNSSVLEGLTPTWVTLGTANATASAETAANAGTTAVRVSVASHTSGILTLDITQPRV